MSNLNDFRTALHGATPVVPTYTLKTDDFTSEAGKAYAVDRATTEVPPVLGSLTLGGVVFTAKAYPAPSMLYIQAGEDVYVEDTYLRTIAEVTTRSQVVAAVNASSVALFTAALESEDGLFPGLDDLYSFHGEAPATTTYSGITATLPSNPPEPSENDGKCIVVDFADTNGTWASYPLTITANRGIEGQEVNFVNNAAGTFFRMMFVGGDTGWRVLASGTKPLNLTAPILSGAYSFTASNGTWTGSPASYAYQWEISDDGETGWTDIEGATSASYLAIEAQQGKFVRCGVIATNANGPSAEVFTAVSAAIVVPDFPLDGLLAFWKLADLTDASGNGNTLTNNNSVTFGAGKIGNAAEFDGSNGLSFTPAAAATTFSVTGWATTASVTGGTPYLFRQHGFVQMHLLSNGRIEIGDNVSWNILGPVPPEDEWFHYVLVVTAGVPALYLNGVSVSLGDGSGSGTLALDDSTVFEIGTGDSGWNGKLDATGIWSRDLTEPEIALFYNDGDGNEPA
jgi:hypothetical protein